MFETSWMFGASEAGSVTALILFALAAIGFSFLCSVAEAVLLCVTPSYIATLKTKRPKAAALLEKLKKNIDRPLAAILSLNTVAHTVGAAGVGGQAAELWDSRAVDWASAVMTFLILVFSEIIPKTLGALYWRPLAIPMGHITRLLVCIFYPLVILSDQITRFLAKGDAQPVVTREEVAAMASLSAAGGDMKHDETRILKNLFRLRLLKVKDIMTPRTVVISFEQNMTVGELLRDHPEIPVSRIPIFKGTIDNVTGFVLKSDILLAQARDEFDTQLVDLRRSLQHVSRNLSLQQLLEVLLEEHEHVALVVDDFGGTSGLVTLEDLIETLLGEEIVDEADTEADMQKFARRQWEKRIETMGLRMPDPEDGISQNTPTETPAPATATKVPHEGSRTDTNTE